MSYQFTNKAIAESHPHSAAFSTVKLTFKIALTSIILGGGTLKVARHYYPLKSDKEQVVPNAPTSPLNKKETTQK
jgi:hypothetical protein